MFGLLLKKQFTEFFRGYFFDQKKGKMRSPGAIAGFFILFAVVILAAAFMFGMLFLGIGFPFVEAGLDWFYFFIAACLAILMGTIGNAFTTYVSLYKCHDNELLISMPIPVKDILGSRLMGVFLMAFGYTAIAYIPALLVYWILAANTAAMIACQLLLFVALVLIVFSLSCLLGWLVAKISLVVRHKSVLYILLAFLFVGLYIGYYGFVQPNINVWIEQAAEHGEEIKAALGIFYHLGTIGTGEFLPLIIVLAGAILVLALVLYFLIKSFLSIATSKGNSKRVAYKEKPVKQNSVQGALLKREFSHFFNSPAYLINCGLGAVFMIFGAGAIFIKGFELKQTLDAMIPFRGMVEIGLLIAIGMLLGMITTGAPCISIEGRNFYQLQVLPIKMWDIVQSKLALRLIISIVPALLAAIGVAIVSGDVLLGLVIVLSTIVFTIFYSLLDVALGVWKPLMQWNTETQAVKSNINVLVELGISWIGFPILAVLYGIGGFLIGPILYSLVIDVIRGDVSFCLYRYLKGSGSESLTYL